MTLLRYATVLHRCIIAGSTVFAGGLPPRTLDRRSARDRRPNFDPGKTDEGTRVAEEDRPATTARNRVSCDYPKPLIVLCEKR
jgi:hypothetical protein